MAKKNKKKNSNYITKADLEAKRENETWEQYFEIKEATRKLVYKNKMNQAHKDFSNI